MPRQTTIAGAAQTIAGTSFYGMLIEADRAQLRRRGTLLMHQPGSELMLEGDLAASAIILVQGWAKSAFTAATGAEGLLRIYGPGDLFGTVIFEDQRCPETVSALMQCRSLMLTGERFAELRSGNLNIARAFRQVVMSRAQTAEEQAKSIFYPPAGRLARILLDLAVRHGVQAPDGITIPVELSQEEMACMIGVSRSTVARVLRDLRLRGIVRTGYRRITVTNLGHWERWLKVHG